MNIDDGARLLNLFERTTGFLTKRSEKEAAYNELIDALGLVKERYLTEEKPTIKIVGPSVFLATKLQEKNEANATLRSLYNFEIAAPIKEIQPILRHSDGICLLYDSTHGIPQYHQRFVELTIATKIPVCLLVHRRKSIAGDRFEDWLAANDFFGASLQVPLNDFFCGDDPQQLSDYQQYLIDLIPKLANSRINRLEQAAKQEINYFFQQQISQSWQEINQIKNQYLAGEQLFFYQQRLRQNIARKNQFKEQTMREIRQAIERSKLDSLNPYLVHSAIFEMQQILVSAQAKTIRQPPHTYLYLVLPDLPQAPFLYDLVKDLCQQKAAAMIEREWSNACHVYGRGGLQALLTRTNTDLRDLIPLLEEEDFDPLKLTTAPTFDFALLVDRPALEFNSRIIFDYSYLQSSWFRLSVSIGVGAAIYLLTRILFGEGRYFGFLIIIFQIINLITGQNIKKARLKQQTKELKRMVDQKYQALIRITLTRASQTLIQAIERVSQQEREQSSKAIAIAQQKLDKLKQTSDLHQNRIDTLKSDRDKIDFWLN
ncbi:MAG: hypothetical protein AAFQ41_15755 [Cyanobacteria bacterium J06623_7]